MKTIGLIGGMSWESSLEYYRIINTLVRDRRGGFSSARSIMYSVDFAEMESLMREGKWEIIADLLSSAGKRLESAGAGCVLLCTNTMHLVADEIQHALSVPLIHIADTAAAAMKKDGIQRAALLGTRFTMEKDFYRGRIASRHGIDVLVPEEKERTAVHEIIFNELVMGTINPASRERLKGIMAELTGRGAGGIILGCTELPLLARPEDAAVPLYDTTALHAEAAVNWMLNRGQDPPSKCD